MEGVGSGERELGRKPELPHPRDLERDLRAGTEVRKADEDVAPRNPSHLAKGRHETLEGQVLEHLERDHDVDGAVAQRNGLHAADNLRLEIGCDVEAVVRDPGRRLDETAEKPVASAHLQHRRRLQGKDLSDLEVVARPSVEVGVRLESIVFLRHLGHWISASGSAAAPIPRGRRRLRARNRSRSACTPCHLRRQGC